MEFLLTEASTDISSIEKLQGLHQGYFIGKFPEIFRVAIFFETLMEGLFRKLKLNFF